MRRYFLVTATVCIVIFLTLSIMNTTSLLIPNQNQDTVLDGWIIENTNVPILFLNGSSYQMGYQQGVFLQEKIKQNLRAFLHYANITMDLLLETWDEMKPYVPEECIQEIQGIADGSGLSFEEVIAGYMVIVREDMGCFGFSAWGDATDQGQLLHVRCFDQPLEIIDPVTGTPAYENNMIVVRKPEYGIPSVAPSIAGIPHTGGGVNKQGIAVGQQVCWSTDQTFKGTPALFRTQLVLDHARTINDALSILTINNTLGWNYIVSDAKIPIGYAVELSANHTYIGGWDQSQESTFPFWAIKDIVRRTNFFIDPTLASTQRQRYSPAGLINFLELVQRKSTFYAIWRSYKVISQDISKNWGTLNRQTTMNLIRKGYAGDTDLVLKLIVILAERTSFNRAWNIWVANPQSGDILVCFAHHDKIAFENPVYHFNMYELFETHPP